MIYLSLRFSFILILNFIYLFYKLIGRFIINLLNNRYLRPSGRRLLSFFPLFYKFKYIARS